MALFLRQVASIFLSGFLCFMTGLAIPPAQAQDHLADCRPIARLFGEVICEEDIAPDEKQTLTLGNSAEQGLDTSQDPLVQKQEKLKSILWSTALEKKFGQDSFKPTADEVDTYQNAFKKTLATRYEINKKTRNLVKRLLEENRYDVEHQGLLEEILQAAELSVTFYERRKNHQGELFPEYVEMRAKAEKDLARKIVQSWKIDQLLYNEYGGDIIVKESGLEPIGAYRSFLQAIYEEGALTILDPAYQSVMDDMKAYFTLPHDTLPEEDIETYKNYFSTPVWQLEDGTEQDSFEEIEERLKGIPTLE